MQTNLPPQVGRTLSRGLLGALALWLPGCASVPQSTSLPDADALPSVAALPDPLVMLNGRRVTTRAQWLDERRPELKALFQHYEYGPLPPRPGRIHGTLAAAHSDFLGGKATLKVVTVQTGPASAPAIDLLLVVPNGRSGPAPVLLAMNFCGNHALTADPRVPLNRHWLYGSCQGCVNNLATEAARGSQAADWPLARIVERGYALASFCSNDIDPDRAEVSEGIYAWLAGGDPARHAPANRGTIAAWAWGYHRCVDYLQTDRDLDARRIAAVGHSRNGKTALLAAAFDERIALAIPHQAGCGGTAPARGVVGESVKAINDRFPHWFNAEFKKFNAAMDRLPFDQHGLVALCAPRPVLISCAEADSWSNPAGQFEVAAAASPVYRFLGVEGLAAEAMPAPGAFVDSRLGFYYRAGKHSMTAADWEVFLNFADRHLTRGGAGAPGR